MIKKVIVMGSIMQDMILRMERLPERGEALICDSYTYSLGGKGCNQAISLMKAGADVCLVGCIGEDTNGKNILNRLKTMGLDVTCIQISRQVTGLAVIFLEFDGSNRIAVYPNANMDLEEEHVCSSVGDSACAFLTQLETPDNTIIAGITKAKNNGSLTVLDAGPARQFPLELLDEKIDILSPNESEAHALTGIRPDSVENITMAANVLMRRCHPKYVVFKLGERGSAVVGGTEAFTVEAIKVKVIDTTGAGDAFTAAMTLSYLEDGDIRKAVYAGTAAGALAVQKAGAADSAPTEDEINAVLKNKCFVVTEIPYE